MKSCEPELLAGRVINDVGELTAIPLEEYRRRSKEAKASSRLVRRKCGRRSRCRPNRGPLLTAKARESHRGPKTNRTTPPFSTTQRWRSTAARERSRRVARYVAGESHRRPRLSLAQPPGGATDARFACRRTQGRPIRGEIENRFEQLGGKAAQVAADVVAELSAQWKHGDPRSRSFMRSARLARRRRRRTRAARVSRMDWATLVLGRRDRGGPHAGTDRARCDVGCRN